MSLEVEGLDQLLMNLNEISAKVNDSIDDALNEAGDNLLNEMKNTAAFKDVTGNLRRSIEKTNLKGAGVNKWVDVGPNYKKKGNHAHLLEFGTSKMKARPFIEPAHLSTKNENKEIIKRKLKGALGL